MTTESIDGTELEARWKKAQEGERVFHCEEREHLPPLASRRLQEETMRRWYLGMMFVDVAPSSVLDVGGGPSSLLLGLPAMARRTVLDPLTFNESDEERYRAEGILRDTTPAEKYAGAPHEEVWLYNCLQHVMDPTAVLDMCAKKAVRAIRLFEWVNVPTDELHLHTLSSRAIVAALQARGFHADRSVEGTATHRGHWRQEFLAGVWRRT